MNHDFDSLNCHRDANNVNRRRRRRPNYYDDSVYFLVILVLLSIQIPNSLSQYDLHRTMIEQLRDRET